MSSTERSQAWEAHERQNRMLRLESTPAQRLEWLEQAIEFAAMIRRERRRDADAPTERTPSFGRQA